VYKDLIDQMHFLTSSLLLHLYENSNPAPNVFYYKKPRQAINEPVAPPPPPAVIPKKQEQKPLIAKPAPSPQPEIQLPPVHIHAPFIQTLSVAAAKSDPPYLDDVLEKIKQFGGASLHSEPLSDQTENLLSWKKDYPCFALVSFFSKGSQEELFLQKVGQAAASRLTVPTAFFSMPSLQSAAELSCFSSSGALKTVLFVYDLSLQQKAYEWLASFPSLENSDSSQEVGPLAPKKKLFSTLFYQLVLPPHYEQAADFKAALWKALQQLLVR
jgi:hypothetical protein